MIFNQTMTIKNLLKSIFLALFCSIICSSCNSIEQTTWKYNNGFYIGDVISFNSYFTLKNDTIYSKEIPIAIVVNTKQRITDKLLLIKAIHGDSIGSYVSK